MKLTEKQKRLIDFFIELGDYTKAARKAGYSEASAKDAPKWFNPRESQYKPYLKQALDTRLKEFENSRIATADEVLKFLTSSMRGEIKEEKVVTEGDGLGYSKTRIVETAPSVRDRIEAAKSLLKRYPMQLDAKEQKLRLQKLEAEIRAATDGDQVAGKESLVRIYLPDNGRGDNA
nr:MAG TPA: Terminase small subunit [Caudoviricetes sp.]